MNRLARALLHAATAISLLACLATLALWERSYRVTTQIQWMRPDPSRPAVVSGRYRYPFTWMHAIVASGGFTLAVRPTELELRDVPRTWKFVESPTPRLTGSYETFWRRMGFLRFASGEFRVWSVPFWFVSAVGAALPAYRMIRFLRSRRPAKGLCAHCGYDLRATPDRCPECGRGAALATPPA